MVDAPVSGTGSEPQFAGLMPPAVAERVQAGLRGGRLWLFLDYDGTLVPIAPTPTQAVPDPDLLALLAVLASIAAIKIAVISGRALASLQEFLPVPGLTLAGTYGIEMVRPGSPASQSASQASLRGTLDRVKAAWTQLVAGREGFLIEDKGLAIALHARFAAPADAAHVLPAAQSQAQALSPGDTFRLLGGDRFLEVAPRQANKGLAIQRLLEEFPPPPGCILSFGDDDKDEEAHALVRQYGGIPVIVGDRFHSTQALYHVPSPIQVRAWLRTIATAAGEFRNSP